MGFNSGFKGLTDYIKHPPYFETADIPSDNLIAFDVTSFVTDIHTSMLNMTSNYRVYVASIIVRLQ